MGRSGVEWTRGYGLRLAWMAQPRIYRPRRGLVGLAPHLGMGWVRLGVGSWFMGLGRPLGQCLGRRHRRPTVDCCTSTDLRRAPADRVRTALYQPTADRSGPATRRR